jgi:dihydropteroate synthase
MIGDRTFDLATRPLVMGILNVTPDSFHDGGRYLDPAAAIRRGEELLAEGADLIDVGAESTRPGAENVPAAIQLGRLRDVVRKLVRLGATVSVDTRLAEVAAPLLEIGAVVVNDVSGLGDPTMASSVARAGASLVIMHMRGEPRTMQIDPRYEDLFGEIGEFLAARHAAAASAGVTPARIALDPGVGFGKTAEDNLRLIAGLDRLLGIGAPIMVGLSRKSFLGAIECGRTPEERIEGTLAASVLAYARGARIFRAHDPAATHRALRAAEAILAAGQPNAGRKNEQGCAG